MASLDKDTEALKNKVRQTSKTVQELEESVEFNVEDISDLKKDVKAVSWDVNSLRKNLLYQERYNRRENLIFNGITEQTTPSGDNSEAAENPQENTKQIIEDTLKIDNPRSKIEFQRVHRLGKTRSDKARPITARFLRYAGREEVLSKARITSKDTNFSVFEDIAKELYELRKSQFNELKEAKKKGLSAYFSEKYPDKLYVNGKFTPRDQYA